MRQYQLCTYRFTTEKAAGDYLPIWKSHIESMKAVGIEAHGFFSVPSEPKQVVAIISYSENADPEAVLQDYVESAGFKNDMAENDLEQMISADKLILKPGEGSPLG